MDEKITNTVTCSMCARFDDGCPQINPDSPVNDCIEFSPKYAGEVILNNDTEPKPFVCDTCGYKGGCGHVPNRDGSCLYGPVPVKLHDSKDVEAIYKEALQAVTTCAEKHANDMVNHPNHYTQGGIECIKAIEASMPPEGFQDYCKGNVIKYTWRFRQKNGLEDLKKARVYLNWMIESLEKEQDNNGSL